jgi:predicted PurR-regulated permease PerM
MSEPNTSKNPIFINITALGVVKIVLVLVLFYFLFQIREILAILFISLVLASAFDPWVAWLKTKKIPRAVSMMSIYLITFLVISGTMLLIIPPIIEQVGELSHQYPFVSEKIRSGIDTLKGFTSLDSIWNNLMVSQEAYPEMVGTFQTVFSKISGFVGGVFTFFLIVVITFYMVVEESALKKVIWSITPKQHQVKVMHIANQIQQRIGLWLRGQLILSFIIFVLTFIGLSILRVKYALVLALIAGITESVPYLGPGLASIPAVFLAFTQAPMLAVFTAALYYVIHLTESNIVVPKLMQKVVGINPIVSIAVLLIGFKIGGIIGAILSIPVVTALKVVFNDIFEKGSEDI